MCRFDYILLSDADNREKSGAIDFFTSTSNGFLTIFIVYDNSMVARLFKQKFVQTHTITISVVFQ